MKVKRENEESLTGSCKKLMMVEPFYGLFLMNLHKQWTDKVDTSGVGKNGINVMLYINEIFWESLKDLWKLYVLKYDILNVVFHHIEIGDELTEKDIMNIASSIVCNQYIDPTWIPLFDVAYRDYRDLNLELIKLLKEDLKSGKKTREEVVEEWRKIPPRGVHLQDFPELNLEEKKGLKYYYDKLLQAKGKQPGKGKNGGGSECLNDLLGDKGDGLPDHWSKDWADFEGMSEADKKLLQAQVDYHLTEIAEHIKKSRGTVPSELEGYINSLNKDEPPKFDWKRYLRRFTGGSQKVFTKKLHRKYNKRFEELPGLKIKPKRRILVCVDTSGSVSNSELKEFFHEIYHMHKMGSEVVVLQCDAAISNIAPYKRGCEDKIAIHGRGGTEFTPAVDYYNEHKKDFSCAIYLTDGECPPPANKPRGRLLWVLSSKCSKNDELQPQIKLN